MKNILSLILVLGFSYGSSGQGTTGRISWKPRPEVGSVGYVYLLDSSCDPAGGRQQVLGLQYSAQLWYAPSGVASEDSLRPIPNLSIAWFSGGGIMTFPDAIEVSGTAGGDLIGLQFRVWDNRDGTIQSWEKAVADPSVAKGKSTIVQSFKLGGVSTDGLPIAGGGLRQPEFTICAVPEPSALSIAACIALGLALSLRRDGRARSG